MLEQFSHASFTADTAPDIRVRQAALDPQKSFAIAAPAGSGKTGLLTQRVLTLLNYCEEPEEILAMTFTRKAAGEMQERILHALWKAKEEPAPEDPHTRLTWQLASKVLQRDQERHWNLLLNPQRLRVQTIDGLCRSITRQLPLASGLGAQPETLEPAEDAYRLAVRELFNLLEQDSPLREDLAGLLRHLDNNLSAIENLLVALLAKREQWMEILLLARAQDAREYLEKSLTEVITDHLQKLAECLQLHASDLCELADQAATNLLQVEADQKNTIVNLHGIVSLPDTEAAMVSQWVAIADLLLTNTGTYRARLTKNEGFPAGKNGAGLKEKFAQLIVSLQETQPECASLLHSVRELPTACYDDNQWQLLDSLTRLLPLLVAQLTLVFKQLGATDYSAISQAAILALGEEDAPSDIALQLDYRIRHILVDEFQDTASTQLLLLKKLTAGWQPGDGRTLFIVGDGMQSCYGFRNANVGLFLDARHQGIGSTDLIALDLSVNFRSQAKVVQWVNDTFYHAFPSTDDISRGAVKYSPSVAFNQALDDDAVNFYACIYTNEEAAPAEEIKSNSGRSTVDDDESSSDGRAGALLREADAVVQLVRQAQTDDAQGTIAILVRTRTHLAQILPALSRAGLSWQATDIDSLASRMAIMDLMSLTRALVNPADRIAWLAVLRAPWCGLDLHDLYHLANTDLSALSPRAHENDYPVIWQQLQHAHRILTLTDHGQQCVKRLLDVLLPAWQSRRRKPLRQWLEGIWLALGGPAILLDKNDLDDIESYFSLLEKYQEGGGIRDWLAFDQAVKKLYAAPKADADPRLQVMTIHKAKGLEFDTVIIPALDRKPRQDDHELLLWQERLDAQGERQLLLGPLAATGENQSQLYRFMRVEKEKQQAYEATRLLYVGCTRAVKRLHLLACLPKKNEEIIAPTKNSLLASIWGQVKNQLQAPPKDHGHRADGKVTADLGAQERPGLQHILRLPPQWELPTLGDVKLLENYRGHEYGDEENLPEAENRHHRLARHTGTLLHRCLQVITEKNLAHQLSGECLAPYFQQQQTFWQLFLQQQGWRGEELSSAVERIKQAITLTLADTRGRWLLDHTHQQSACELVVYHQAESLREFIIDRTFIAEGVRWIIDYKSSEPLTGQTESAFIADEIELYRPQLKKYQQIFSAIESSEIKTALYFPLLQHTRWVEL